MRTPRQMLWDWLDRRGRIPFFVRWVFPRAHFCSEMDGLLILDDEHNCFCDVCNKGLMP